MFGIKKLQVEMKYLQSMMKEILLWDETNKQIQDNQHRQILAELSHQKIDLSKINTRFHDLGEKIEKSQKFIEKFAELTDKNITISVELLEKVTTNDAILCHVKELNEKLNFLFDYMRQLEKLLNKVELITDECLPEKTLKLPKKKKATN